MSTLGSHPASNKDKNDYSKGDKVALGDPYVIPDSVSYGEGQDVLAGEDVDPALTAKMHIVNNVR